ncbi:hypothetical protein E2562_000995 [Oryza meyeriana var. granulata]|uniref:Uncharacterized protein n=1 Tax=Oryza meyeriana var. granulata TaxID=110450 RepID=A0A6G1CYF6_9ORYZ|nr:hypothetical protein E2562_000995 [Oryza meyeriana var. granulata]
MAKDRPTTAAFGWEARNLLGSGEREGGNSRLGKEKQPVLLQIGALGGTKRSCCRVQSSRF